MKYYANINQYEKEKYSGNVLDHVLSGHGILCLHFNVVQTGKGTYLITIRSD